MSVGGETCDRDDAYASSVQHALAVGLTVLSRRCRCSLGGEDVVGCWIWDGDVRVDCI
jgi:hypothetical protein